MANLNKVMLIGRLTRDPEMRTFANGGKMAAFGFAVTNKKKNQATGQWDDDPMFIDVKIFTRGENTRQVDLVEQSLRKGHQVFLEGHLTLDQWDDKTTGQKRSKHVLVIDNFQFLERRQDGEMGDGGSRYQRSSPAPQKPAMASPPMDESGYEDPQPPMREGPGGAQEDIPF